MLNGLAGHHKTFFVSCAFYYEFDEPTTKLVRFRYGLQVQAKVRVKVKIKFRVKFGNKLS